LGEMRMEIKEAQKKVDKRIHDLGGYWAYLSMFARLVEEVGELGRELNIKYGDKKRKSNEDEKGLEKELADVLFTLLAISNKVGVDMDKALLKKMKLDYEIDKETYMK
jgi:NTP pyrophosphatase (non-canonical NTP hydrolase)